MYSRFVPGDPPDVLHERRERCVRLRIRAGNPQPLRQRPGHELALKPGGAEDDDAASAPAHRLARQRLNRVQLGTTRIGGRRRRGRHRVVQRRRVYAQVPRAARVERVVVRVEKLDSFPLRHRVRASADHDVRTKGHGSKVSLKQRRVAEPSGQRVQVGQRRAHADDLQRRRGGSRGVPFGARAAQRTREVYIILARFTVVFAFAFAAGSNL